MLTLAQYIILKWKSRAKGNKLPNIWSLPRTATGEPRESIKQEIDNEHARKQLYARIKSGIMTDYDDYLAIKEALKGGYTHCNPHYYAKPIIAEPDKGIRIFSRDKTSFYPYLMLTKTYPYSMKHIDDSAIYDKDLESGDYATIFTVEFKGLKLNHDGFPYLSESKGSIKGRLITDNGKVVYADYLADVITDLDWVTIKNNYTWKDCRKYNAMQGRKQRLPLPYLLCVTDWYIAKTIYKGDEEKVVIYQNAKGKVNAIFGMSCTDPCKITIYYLNGKWIDDSEEEEFDIKKYTEEKLIEMCEKYTSYSVKKGCQLCNLYQWGCYITAYARSIIMEHNIFIGIMNVLYNDTDSTYYVVYSVEEMERINKYFDNYHKNIIQKELKEALEYINLKIASNEKWNKKHELLTEESFSPKNNKGESFTIGLMDIEHELKAFKSLGAKRYSYIYYDKKKDRDILQPTVAGISKNNMRKYILAKCKMQDKQFYSYDDMWEIMSVFNNNTYVGMFESGKQCISYHEEFPDKILVKDHNGLEREVEITTGACFLKIPFSMKENNVTIAERGFADMLDVIDQFAIEK